MFELLTDETEGEMLLTIRGEATIENTDEFLDYARKFTKGAAKKDGAVISIEEVTKTDIAFLQIIESISSTLKSAGVKVAIRLDKLQERTKAVLEMSGFLRHFGGADSE